MENTTNRICRCIAMLLEQHGVKRAIVSPGSRNAPLLIAISRRNKITTDVVIDERSAAFIALGYALISQEPVALICTSGSALLNYAPAISEAFYRKIPLIVISADRPKAWIGQDDSQTIVQADALRNYVKRSYDISPDQTDNNVWYANRIANDAILTATSGRIGPVHINVQLDEPLGTLADDSNDSQDQTLMRTINMIRPTAKMETREARDLGRTIASPVKVMIVCGFMNPDKTLNKALMRLSELPNIVVVTETLANLHGKNFITSIDGTLASMKDENRMEYVPDVVITTGGALVSRHIKQLFRSNRIKAHWHVGEIEDTVDCFQQLTTRIEMDPGMFFQQLASAMQPHRQECDFARKWHILKDRADSLTMSYAAKSPWSDLKAFATLLPMIPRRWNVQYSNGTSVRYAQIFSQRENHRCDCNRGVSGIDGCTSTAIGASLAYGDTTLLITGDTSCLYDIGALSCELKTPRFKIIVINNDGGGIFRFIASTSALDVRERMFCAPSSHSIYEIGQANGFSMHSASDETELRRVFPIFANENQHPAMLVVNTPGELSAEILKEYFTYCKSKK